MSQNDAILDALLRGEKLTPLDALKQHGCFRLGARIWDLRKQGYRIERELIDVGNGKHVAQYSMPPGCQMRLAV
jgi:hypothetical protein